MILTVELFMHKSLDLYAFVAFTESSLTLSGLIEMVRDDNDKRQRFMDERGLDCGRKLHFS